jgi:hypothetical protein
VATGSSAFVTGVGFIIRFTRNYLEFGFLSPAASLHDYASSSFRFGHRTFWICLNPCLLFASVTLQILDVNLPDGKVEFRDKMQDVTFHVGEGAQLEDGLVRIPLYNFVYAKSILQGHAGDQLLPVSLSGSTTLDITLNNTLSDLPIGLYPEVMVSPGHGSYRREPRKPRSTFPAATPEHRGKEWVPKAPEIAPNPVVCCPLVTSNKGRRCFIPLVPISALTS